MQRKRYFLVVDDDFDVRESVVDSLPDLSAFQVEVIQASNGVDGLAKVDQYEPIAILSDISMPQMNGLNFLREIRTRGFETPFVVLSAYFDTANTIQALRLGAFDFLSKPFNPPSLHEKILPLMKYASAARDVEDRIHEWMSATGQPLSDDQTKEIMKAREALTAMRYKIWSHPSKAS